MTGAFVLAMAVPLPAFAATVAVPAQAQRSEASGEVVTPALYAVRFVGAAGGGRGSLYVGHGIVSGVDVTGGTYDGSYGVNEGRVHGIASMRALGETQLVTGQRLDGGQALEIRFELPVAIDETATYDITVGGQPVRIQLRKVRDLP
ncbi:hypothetical protein [Aureimonas sp. AU4]|uniref:hypothetical protein n=1 Tax=Aureimonas sp. AU4 TaxID=1638163 RepID=UPI000784C9B2|nr:hypothetical protein [Aureimonas sp. AU4]